MRLTLLGTSLSSTLEVYWPKLSREFHVSCEFPKLSHCQNICSSTRDVTQSNLLCTMYWPRFILLFFFSIISDLTLGIDSVCYFLFCHNLILLFRFCSHFSALSFSEFVYVAHFSLPSPIFCSHPLICASFFSCAMLHRSDLHHLPSLFFFFFPLCLLFCFCSKPLHNTI